QVGADLVPLVFQAVTGSARLLEHELATLAIADEIERALVRLDDLAPIRRDHTREDGRGALAKFRVWMLAQLLDTRRAALARSNLFRLNRRQQRRDPLRPREHHFDRLAPHRR